jgi:hypothetical protein
MMQISAGFYLLRLREFVVDGKSESQLSQPTSGRCFPVSRNWEGSGRVGVDEFYLFLCCDWDRLPECANVLQVSRTFVLRLMMRRVGEVFR